ncbi:hypothetical protein DRO66_06450 [Candidatus Bathyarchaeota archaeon]|nr:MAG: hypothetical protein DRO66_06450 [Candidatus Bathyarchaeota archaeon]
MLKIVDLHDNTTEINADMLDNTTIGDRIKHVRVVICDLSMLKFAEILNRHRDTLSRYENNETEPPAQLIVEICENWDVSSDWMLKGKRPILESEVQNIKSATQPLGVTEDNTRRIKALEEREEQMHKTLYQMFERLDIDIRELGIYANSVSSKAGS